ncbi:PECTIN LYASE-LIKE SUPERFAMILY PROTEIN [Salix koriyanagi]|uniref:PECTIN LYASE-LIKE SUPERFAMILY PROTEIN n=1 Tax=Salix koriyanagi TaxID=2511006 RepID=A0A9Q0Q855_9ROSI|nr:PECTIN LYASE-LIKE SUPERFAMILY PROTEIN [Salix koriyanagi]
MELWTSARRSKVIDVRGVLGVLVLFYTIGVESRKSVKWDYFEYGASSCRAHSASVSDFGGVGDGTTVNTKAFQAAIDHLSQFSSEGGSLLYVPPGRWLTGSFNLTSYFTLYLDKDAVLLGSENESEYPLIEPLPSYGRGRDADGARYSSLIFGKNLTDVVITGANGTIDGQGELWWTKFRAGKLDYTRPYLIEIMFSTDVQISNLTLINSPSWNVHPVYCSNVVVQDLTILAPVKSPNTDGINPDSCTNTRIQDCYIVSGDDCVAVKSGWDEYVIALGSEMSGGIEDVRAEDITAIDSESGVRIKTAVGRGGYVKDVYVRGMTLKTMKWVFWMTGNYGSHPDNNYDPNAIPVIQNINYRDVVAENVTMAAKLEGIAGDPFTGICISNVTIGLAQNSKKLQWNCTDVAGITSEVNPKPCDLLPDQGQGKIEECNFPEDSLPVENMGVQTCYFFRRHW